MSIASEYASYCATLEYEDLPEHVIDYTKRLIEDHIALAVGGAEYSPSAGAFIDGVQSLDETPNNSGNATVLATGDRMSPAYASLLNGALSHSLDYDDTVLGGHVGAPVIAAALAAAEAADASGEDFLCSVVAGYEIMTRVLLAINRPVHYNRGFHPTATCGVFGATAAIGRAYRSETTVFENAFGCNASQVAGTNGYSIHGGWNKRIHPGLAAHSGMIAVKMAMAGFEGIDRPLEGKRNVFHAYTSDPNIPIATAGLGDQYHLLETGLKPYPCGRRNHTAMDIAIELSTEHEISVDEITRINVEVSKQNVTDLATPVEHKTHPKTLVDAQFSMPFGIAVGIVRGDAGIETFIDEFEGGYSSEVQDIMDCIVVESNDNIFEDDALIDYHARITIESDTGTVTEGAARPTGEPEKPMSDEQRAEKFQQLTTTLTSSQQDEIRQGIEQLEDYSITDLTSIFRSTNA